VRAGARNAQRPDWDKSITVINRGRVFSDVRVARYLPSTLTVVTRPRTTGAIGGRVDFDGVELTAAPSR
jgi:hypothetical protein